MPSTFGFVWRTAANRGIPRAALDDVAQEVFIVVDRKLHEFEGRASLRTWIAAIVRRVLADYLKKRSNRPAGDEPLEREPAAAAASGEALEQRAALELLDSLMAKMTDDQREVFVLHEIEELSGAEIAEISGVNENTVWTRLRAARRIFQDGVARRPGGVWGSRRSRSRRWRCVARRRSRSQLATRAFRRLRRWRAIHATCSWVARGTR